MKDLARLTITLTLICLSAGLLLAWTNLATRDLIAQAEARTRLRALESVLPDYDNDPMTHVMEVRVGETAYVFHIATMNDGFAGAACEVVSPEGYSGDISIMVGMAADGTVRAIEILQHKETPGLGAKITDNSFKGKFAGVDARSARWATRKDGGDFDEITAATISSRAVVNAVAAVADAFLKHSEELRSGRPDAADAADQEYDRGNL